MTRPVRLLELVTFLARRAKTIREIAGRFEISERTAFRDIADLSARVPITRTEHGLPAARDGHHPAAVADHGRARGAEAGTREPRPPDDAGHRQDPPRRRGEAGRRHAPYGGDPERAGAGRTRTLGPHSRAAGDPARRSGAGSHAGVHSVPVAGRTPHGVARGRPLQAVSPRGGLVPDRPLPPARRAARLSTRPCAGRRGSARVVPASRLRSRRASAAHLGRLPRPRAVRRRGPLRRVPRSPARRGACTTRTSASRGSGTAGWSTA